jgi:hypothetical protein
MRPSRACERFSKLLASPQAKGATAAASVKLGKMQLLKSGKVRLIVTKDNGEHKVYEVRQQLPRMQ